MSTQILISALAGMVALTYLAYRYLNWQPIAWLGGLIATPAAFALFIHLLWSGAFGSLYDGATWHGSGEIVQILGEYSWLAGFAIAWAAVLLVVALYKRNQQPDETDTDATDKETENLSQLDIIRKELADDLNDVESELRDAKLAGHDDAVADGGPFPRRDAESPPAGFFESDARKQYSALANRFAANTIDRLKRVITDALRGLATIKSAVNQHSYKDIANGHYHENSPQVDGNEVEKIMKNFTDTQMEKKRFLDTLKLKPAEQPDWAKRTSLKELIVLGVLFALIEFVVSYWFLKDGSGVEGAQRLAAIAIAIIIICSFLAGVLFQWMRHNIPPIYRILSSVAYFVIWFVVFGALGYLLGLRNPDSKDGTPDWDVIIQSYTGLFGDLNNLVVLLVNVFALGFFYWKVLHWCEKFHGFDDVNDKANVAKDAHDELFASNKNAIKGAISHASANAKKNAEAADKHCADIEDAKTTLTEIQQIIVGEYQRRVYPVFNQKITSYRQSNCTNRVMAANPAPKYFNDDEKLEITESDLVNADDVAKFLNSENQKIEAAPKERDGISEKSQQWAGESATVSAEMSREFQKRIDILDTR